MSSPPPEPLWLVDGRTDASATADMDLPLPGWVRFAVELEDGRTIDRELLVLDRPRVRLELELD